MKTKLISVLALFIILSTSAFAALGDLSLYSSLTTSGERAGGLGMDLGNGFGADIAGSVFNENGESITGYYVDACWGPWIMAIKGQTDTAPQYSLGYCVEAAVGETLTVGLSFDLFTLQEGVSAQHFSAWDSYIKIPLKF